MSSGVSARRANFFSVSTWSDRRIGARLAAEMARTPLLSILSARSKIAGLTRTEATMRLVPR
jgi:hypothetical protein